MKTACIRDEKHPCGRGLPLPVHLPVHLPEALPRPEGECWLWTVGVDVCPTATSGCRGSHSAGSFHPRLLCVFCVCLWSGSRCSPASTIARSLQTSVPVHPKQPGLPPLAPRPRSPRRYHAAHSAAPRRGREVAPPKCFCSVGVGCLERDIRTRARNRNNRFLNQGHSATSFGLRSRASFQCQEFTNVSPDVTRHFRKGCLGLGERCERPDKRE